MNRLIAQFGKVIAIAAAAYIGAAGAKQGDGDVAGDVAARVNKVPVSVRQVDSLMTRVPNLNADRAPQVRRQVLEGLVDQEILVQQALAVGMDRDPRVAQALDAARREVLARFALEKLSEPAQKPAAKEVEQFYNQHPELFADRKVYLLRELAITTTSANAAKVKDGLAKAKDFAELANWLKAEKIPFTGNAGTKAAEQLPLSLVGRLNKLSVGQMAVIPARNGVLVVQVAAADAQPLDQARARPFIERFVLNQRRAELAASGLKQLKTKAKVEYLGEYAKLPRPSESDTAESGATAQGVADGNSGSSLPAGSSPGPAK